MITRRLKIETTSFWHAGSGHGDGPGADALPYKTAEGLPAIPGRTIRGLLRDAVEAAGNAGSLPAAVSAEALFGTEIAVRRGAEEREKRLEAARFNTTEGLLIVDSALIGDTPAAQAQWRAWARKPDSTTHKAGLWRRFASTAIEASGVAKDKSLRTIEHAVPLTLTAFVSYRDDAEGAPPAADVFAALDESLVYLKTFGSDRNRGLGRANFSFEAAE